MIIILQLFFINIYIYIYIFCRILIQNLYKYWLSEPPISYQHSQNPLFFFPLKNHHDGKSPGSFHSHFLHKPVKIQHKQIQAMDYLTPATKQPCTRSPIFNLSLLRLREYGQRNPRCGSSTNLHKRRRSPNKLFLQQPYPISGSRQRTRPLRTRPSHGQKRRCNRHVVFAAESENPWNHNLPPPLYRGDLRRRRRRAAMDRRVECGVGVWGDAGVVDGLFVHHGGGDVIKRRDKRAEFPVRAASEQCGGDGCRHRYGERNDM